MEREKLGLALDYGNWGTLPIFNVEHISILYFKTILPFLEDPSMTVS
jgi:hypothetical protein